MHPSPVLLASAMMGYTYGAERRAVAVVRTGHRAWVRDMLSRALLYPRHNDPVVAARYRAERAERKAARGY
jgi:hypothetical protein